MKTIKNFDNGRLSVTVKQIEQMEEIISERPLNPDEDFSTFHPNTNTTPNPIMNQAQENPYTFGTQTKNVAGFGITITRKLR